MKKSGKPNQHLALEVKVKAKLVGAVDRCIEATYLLGRWVPRYLGFKAVVEHSNYSRLGG